MKNFIYVAVFTALGFNVISCDADSVDSISGGNANKKIKHEVSSLILRETDTISSTDSLTTNLFEEPGPGDDPIIVPPPPKP